MKNSYISDDDFDKEFIESIEKINKNKKSPPKTQEQIHADRLYKIMALNNISTNSDFAFKVNADEKTLNLSLNGKQFLQIKSALIIEEEFGYSLDWIYGLSDIMIDQDKAFFIDIRKNMEIESVYNLKYDNDKLISKEKDILKITLTNNHLNLLNCIRKIDKVKKDQTLSYIECEELMDKYEQEYKNRLYSAYTYIEIPQIIEIAMDEFNI